MCGLFYLINFLDNLEVWVHDYDLKWKEQNSKHSNIRGSLNKFPDFFCMATFIDSTHMKL